MTEEIKKPKIKIYLTPTCPYCHTLKSFLAEKGFEYEEINVAADKKTQEEMTQKSGQIGVPVLEIDGEVIIGFDKKRISELLKIKN